MNRALSNHDIYTSEFSLFLLKMRNISVSAIEKQIIKRTKQTTPDEV